MQCKCKNCMTNVNSENNFYWCEECGCMNMDGLFIMPRLMTHEAVLGEVPRGSLCDICKREINDMHGNPDFWGVPLPYKCGNGKMKYYHRGCVANIIARHFS